MHERERLRGHACQEVCTAAAPAGVGEEKYDPTAVSTLALLKYGSGMPFARLAGLEARYGIPLPESTQYEILQDAAVGLRPVLDELIRHAAQGEVLHNDDSAARTPSEPRARGGGAAQEMGTGPPEPLCRERFQTTASCAG